jgi:hypothetical protein
MVEGVEIGAYVQVVNNVPGYSVRFVGWVTDMATEWRPGRWPIPGADTSVTSPGHKSWTVHGSAACWPRYRPGGPARWIPAPCKF